MGATTERIDPALAEALMSSLDLYELVPAVYGVLGPSIGVDHGAICVTKVGTELDYDWAVARLPPVWFERYREEMAPDDFVARNVALQPNQVLRDQEMLEIKKLRRTSIYQRSRELDLRLERVMAVMLRVQDGWHGGVVLYRATDRPFDDAARALLQSAAGPFAAAIKNCRTFAGVRRRADAWEALLSKGETEAVLMTREGVELERTPGAGLLFDRWFSHAERRRGGVPAPLVNELQALLRERAPDLANWRDWYRRTKVAELRASFVAMPSEGSQRIGAIVLHERAVGGARLPLAWTKRLTERQREVVTAVLQGWDNQLIADELGCSEKTVKKHLQMIYDRLAMPSRAALIANAANLRQ